MIYFLSSTHLHKTVLDCYNYDKMKRMSNLCTGHLLILERDVTLYRHHILIGKLEEITQTLPGVTVITENIWYTLSIEGLHMSNWAFRMLLLLTCICVHTDPQMLQADSYAIFYLANSWNWYRPIYSWNLQVYNQVVIHVWGWL